MKEPAVGDNHISNNHSAMNCDFSEHLADPPIPHTKKRCVIKATCRSNLQHLEYCHYTV